MCTGGESNQGPLGPKSDALSTAPLRLSRSRRTHNKITQPFVITEDVTLLFFTFVSTFYFILFIFFDYMFDAMYVLVYDVETIHCRYLLVTACRNLFWNTSDVLETDITHNQMMLSLNEVKY